MNHTYVNAHMNRVNDVIPTKVVTADIRFSMRVLRRDIGILPTTTHVPAKQAMDAHIVRYAKSYKI